MPSLVGSEMCIRDRSSICQHVRCRFLEVERHKEYPFWNIFCDLGRCCDLAASRSHLYHVSLSYAKFSCVFRTDLNVSRWDFGVERWRSPRHSSGVVVEQYTPGSEDERIVRISHFCRWRPFNSEEGS